MLGSSGLIGKNPGFGGCGGYNGSDPYGIISMFSDAIRIYKESPAGDFSGFEKYGKALGKAMPYLAPGVNVNLDTVAKYTPLLWYRSKGYSTKELGDLAKGNKSLPKYLNWIQMIDVKTTKARWKAAIRRPDSFSRATPRIDLISSVSSTAPI